MARRDTTALIKRLKKRIDAAKKRVPPHKLADLLGEEDLGLLSVESELEFEAEEVHVR